MSYRDHIDELDKAVTNLHEAKATVDAIQEQLSLANTVYHDALTHAQEMHAKFQNALADVLPRQNAGR